MSRFTDIRDGVWKGVKYAAENIRLSLVAMWNALPLRARDFLYGLVTGVGLALMGAFLW